MQVRAGARSLGIAVPQSLPAALASVAWSRARLRMRGLSFTARSSWEPAVLRELSALESATDALFRSDQLRGADFSARAVRRALHAGHPVHAARSLAWELLVRAMSGGDPSSIDRVDALCERLCFESGDEVACFRLHFSRNARHFLGGQPEAALADVQRAAEIMSRVPLASVVYDAAWIEAYRCAALLRPLDVARRRRPARHAECGSVLARKHIFA